jgi:trk system potassium uptake protein TrkH
MNYRTVRYYLGTLLMFSGVFMIIPLIIALVYKQPDSASFAVSGVICLVCGWAIKRRSTGSDLSSREAFFIVTFGWLIMAAFSALPLILSGSCTSFVDAFFESMSGLTTTGATVISSINDISKGTAFWRSFLQWLGGMGFIVLSVAILPKVELGGMDLFKAEAPGPTLERLTPRIRQTAKTLWQIYLGLSILLTILLVLSGLNLFDAVIHTMSAVSTGGFSNYEASVGHFNNPWTEVLLVVFMFLAGCSFTLHYRALTGRSIKGYFADTEFKVFLSIVVTATVLITVNLMGSNVGELWDSLRQAVFQVVSVITTTGFVTSDYGQWPALAGAIILLLMFVGGCAGSTSGSIKVIRLVIAFKHGMREFLRLIHPRSVHHVRVGSTVIEEKIISGVLGFIFLFIFLVIAGTFLLLTEGIDLTTAFFSVVSCLGNVGIASPTSSYALLSPLAKMTLALLMLIGRLELYSVLVLLAPSAWRRSRR